MIWPHLEGLQLADPYHDKEGEIDILIGGITFGHNFLFGVKKCGKNLPVLQQKELGWIISGAHHKSTKSLANVQSLLRDIATEEERFAVVRNNKTTTKMRVVHDASAKMKNSKSLYDLMLVNQTFGRI